MSFRKRNRPSSNDWCRADLAESLERRNPAPDEDVDALYAAWFAKDVSSAETCARAASAVNGCDEPNRPVEVTLLHDHVVDPHQVALRIGMLPDRLEPQDMTARTKLDLAQCDRIGRHDRG